MTGSVTGETRISDDCYGCVDLSGTSIHSQSSFLGLLEKVLVSEEKKMEIEKNTNNP